MIYKRAIARLRAQDWLAIAIEVGIVIIGVFIGNQVSNWNADRIERAETVRMLRNLQPETRNVIWSLDAVLDYYRITQRYADIALAGWRGDRAVSDRDFVIAAYQASQQTYLGTSNQTWSQIIGSDRLQHIEDRDVRERLSLLMTADWATIEKDLAPDYRRHVREVIPEDIQDAIRKDCGDRRVVRGTQSWIRLPETCTLDLPDERFRTAATELRVRPALIGDLRFQRSAIASYVEVIHELDKTARSLLGRIERM